MVGRCKGKELSGMNINVQIHLVDVVTVFATRLILGGVDLRIGTVGIRRASVPPGLRQVLAH